MYSPEFLDQVFRTSFWTDSNGSHPDRWLVLHTANVVQDVDTAVNGKWAATDPDMRVDAHRYVLSNVSLEKPLVLI